MRLTADTDKINASELSEINRATGINFTASDARLTGNLPEGKIVVEILGHSSMPRLSIAYLGESVTQNTTVARRFLIREVTRMVSKVLQLKRKKILLESGHSDLVVKQAALTDALGIREWRVIWAIIKYIAAIMVRADKFKETPEKFDLDPSKVLELPNVGLHSKAESQMIIELANMSKKQGLIFLLRMLTLPALSALVYMIAKHRKQLAVKVRSLITNIKNLTNDVKIGEELFNFVRSLTPSDKKAMKQVVVESKPR